MKNRTGWIAAMIGLMSFPMLAGCLRGPEARPAVLGAFNSVASTELVNHAGLKPGQVPEVEALAKLRAAYSASNDAEARRLLRNQIVASLMVAIKNYHEAVEDDVFEKVTELQIMFDMLGLAANLTGTTVGGATAKTITSAIAAGAIGTRASLESNVLAENTKFAVLLQMNADRKEKETMLLNNLKLTDKQFSLDMALPLVFDYYTAGSLREAVAGLVESGQKRLKAAEADLRSVKSSETKVPDDKLNLMSK